MADQKVPDINTPETLRMLKSCRVLEHGESYAKVFQPGEEVTVSGLDKQELLSRKLATRDLKAPKAEKASEGK